ncbi:alpha-amylase [Flavobacterium sp. CYK-4]|uniref:alpha-amylase family glycosyl hydrolase n=1 Tax=Flavobacterium lotistagni TaxID=2709660 RepID=UPI00140C71DD|nr:alpha-amylase family glycosyl hydrolase [Flavobacterium lotistagni]NHM06746.1 alpha-amylase [Flavobacterium lotistagni]
MKKTFALLLIAFALNSPVSLAQNKKTKAAKTVVKKPFVWEGANLYFLMTDRFFDGNPTKQTYFNRTKSTAKLRGFEGGNLRGIIEKLDEGYFDKLGVNAIWFTPIVEQIHDGVDEGTGLTYGFHGYWTRDWTALDPNFGTKKDLAELVTKAHAKGIRIVLDGVINHTGPVTEIDTVWPSDWVRTSPQCDYKTYQNTTACTLVKNLPDVLTESNANVELPSFLVEKWKKEGRYESEMASLDAFFKRTGYPRAPKYYIIKWLTDYILEFGIDGYRGDTVKHVDEAVWADFKTQCDYAFAMWKKKHPKKVLDNNPFYTIAEVYNYGISAGQDFDFGDKKVNYFKHGFNNMINFEFKWNAAQMSYEGLFSKYSDKLNGELKGYSVLNYISSHDDSKPFDGARTKNFEAGTKLLLTPGVSQIYYGDETGRSLEIEGTEGDATLRSFMNWNEVKSNPETQKILAHWQKIGLFRKNHPAVGAGIHEQLSAQPYVFSRTFTKGKYSDQVVIGLELKPGKKDILVGKIFKNGTKVKDAYSGKTAVVTDGKVIFDTDFDLVLIEKL